MVGTKGCHCLVLSRVVGITAGLEGGKDMPCVRACEIKGGNECNVRSCQGKLIVVYTFYILKNACYKTRKTNMACVECSHIAVFCT
jgi:hypothetical protein